MEDLEERRSRISEVWPTVEDYYKSKGCTDEEFEEAMEIWNSIEDEDEIFDTNIEFIRGNIKATPHHSGPLHSDSAELTDDLIKLHENKNFFSMEGQGSVSKENYEQRAYVVGYIKPKFLPYLFSYIESFNRACKDDKIYYFVKSRDNPYKTNIISDKAEGEQHLYNLTRVRHRDKKWVCCTSLGIDNDDDFYNELEYSFSRLDDSVQEFVVKYFIKNEYESITLVTEEYGSKIKLEQFLQEFFERFEDAPKNLTFSKTTSKISV